MTGFDVPKAHCQFDRLSHLYVTGSHAYINFSLFDDLRNQFLRRFGMTHFTLNDNAKTCTHTLRVHAHVHRPLL